MNEKQAKKYVEELGVLEFSFLSEGIVTFKSIKGIDDGTITHKEVSFFVEPGDTFFRRDRMVDFLGSMKIFEILVISEDNPTTLYHKKYDE